MCENCGCSDDNNDSLTSERIQHDHSFRENPNYAHYHVHDHDHSHEHPHTHPHSHESKTIEIERDVLSRNNLLAERNRGFFDAKNILAINFVSSPGSGKTTLLERTIRELSGHFPVSVIEGDQQTDLDAERIKTTGVKVNQINTGNGCHLNAGMVNNSLKLINPDENSFLFIENVGNLVCPALFDLGEKFRVLVISVTEGEDKPLKYPNMFQSSHLCLINKCDLLPHIDFNLELFKQRALLVNGKLEMIELSAKTGEGFSTWLDWLKIKAQ